MPHEVRHSVCALDCPDCCSLLINVDEAGTGSKLRGNPEHPITRGFLCGKVARYLEREYHPDRVLHPLKRTGPKGAGQFQRVSWDEALDLVAQGLKKAIAEAGPESVMPYSYAGTMGILNGSSMDRRFFHRLGASRLHRSICAEAGTVGLTDAQGKRYGMEPERFRDARLIIAWGANILGTNVHLWPFIVEARRNGAKFVVIDPIRTRTAAAADRWYGVQPGSDLALALGLMHVIFAEGLEDRDYLARHTTGVEELRKQAASYTPDLVARLTGLPAEDIVDLARQYATTSPAAIRLNYGVQRSERGGAAVHAIALLPVITGAWKQVGGGMQLSTSQPFEWNTAALEQPELQWKKSPLGREGRLLNMSEVGRVLNGSVDPPVRAMVVYNSNPGAIAPDSHSVRRGLAREDLFTAVLEHFLTDTALYADVVLPATTFLEHTDLYRAYGHYYVQMARPALPPPGETKPNTEIFRLLAARMGFDEPCFRDTDDDLIRTALSSGSAFLEGITLERLEREHFVRLNLPEVFQPFAEGRPDGQKFRLDVDLEYVPPVESRLGDAALVSRFPLELVSAKHNDALNSTFGYRPEVLEDAQRAWLHREDAELRGISSGDRVRVYNDRGTVFCRAEVDGYVRPGVVRIPSVAWARSSPDGVNVNVLTSQRLTDRGAGATFYSCLVQVEKCGD